MAVISVPVHLLTEMDYSNYTYKLNKNKVITEEDVGMVIFGPGQDKAMELFLKDDRYNILFRSNKCYNNRYNDVQRNTLFVFELKETNGKSSNV